MSVREAVGKAIAFFRELQEQAGEQVSGLEVEEVEKSDNDQYWLITLSYLRKPTGMEQVVGALKRERSYKSFKVNAETGEVISMTIRQVHAS